MLLYLSSKHSNVILYVSIKKYIYYNGIYCILTKSRGIMTIPAGTRAGTKLGDFARDRDFVGHPG